MSILNDELFALRINFQDSMMDEVSIIKELKLYLKSKNNCDDTITNILVDFYKSFNIDFTLEFISNIVPTPRVLLDSNNIASFLLNINNQNDSIVNSEVVNNADILNQVDNDDDDILNQVDNDSDDDILNQVDNDSDDDIINQVDNDSDEYIDSDEDIATQEINQLFNNLINSPGVMSYNNDESSLNTDNNFHHFENLNTSTNPETFINNFTNLLSSMNLQSSNNMEDVKVTLDDDALEEISTEILKEDLSEKCSICMMDMKKDEKYSNLSCNHGFHTDCVIKWLKEYNYKCPVCRKECGPSKYHI